MSTGNWNVPVRLVYSYCHEDKADLGAMKTALASLREQGVLEEWLDADIPPGRPIAASVKEKLREADIVVFLFSSRFIASSACREEWDYVKELAAGGATTFRVPVLLAPCAWQEVLGDEDLKVLPTGAKAVAEHTVCDGAWLDVYEGVKTLVEQVRRTFVPKAEFLAGMEKTELLSHEGIELSEIFVLPALTSYEPEHRGQAQMLERRIPDIDGLLSRGNALVHGPEMSGKTALARQLFVHLAGQAEGVLFVDLKASHGAATEPTFRTLYRQQFSGDYELWSGKSGKTAIVDNVDSAPRSRKFIAALKERFERVVVFVSTDTYSAYYRDDRTFADFCEVRLGQLTYVQQEHLIRSRLRLTTDGGVTDGAVDQVEKQVDHVIQRRIVPRYPFYVLSIIQTFEGYMPSNLSITSYGHCYYALIVAKLIKAGVDRSDEDLNACFNFAERLAFALYQAGVRDEADEADGFDFEAFVARYRRTYLIRTSLLNRLKNGEYGIISDKGVFKIPYMHYYFLGKHLAGSTDVRERAVVDEMCNRSYLRSNHLTLMFVIHHATDRYVIDAIVANASRTLADVEPATLSATETGRFNEIISGLPKTVLNDGDVEAQRRRDRQQRDEVAESEVADGPAETDEDVADSEELINDWYRMLKNNEILGHVLRSRYGRLTKDEIASIIETISQGGLRLVNHVLKDSAEIQEVARFVTERLKGKASYEQVARLIQFLSFVWTMGNVEAVVSCVNGANIREVLDGVVEERDTPAYDLIGYFSELDSARELNEDIKRSLRSLLRQHTDPFVRAVLSLRTQHYMNTHRSDRAIEQGICDLLGIPTQRLLLRPPADGGRGRRGVRRFSAR